MTIKISRMTGTYIAYHDSEPRLAIWETHDSRKMRDWLVSVRKIVTNINGVTSNFLGTVDDALNCKQSCSWVWIEGAPHLSNSPFYVNG
jgi:hypothetical protein